MHKNEKVPGNNVTTKDSANRGDVSAVNVSELVQSLADGMMREAREVTARIRKAAEADAARLIEDAEKRADDIAGKAQKDADAAAEEKEKASALLQQAQQRAVAIQAEVTKEAAQVRLRLKEDIDRHLAGVLDKIRQDLRPSLDYLVKRAQTLEEEVCACVAPKAPDADVSPPALSPFYSPPEGHETVRELHSGLGEAIAAVDASIPEPPPCEENGSAETEDEVAATEESVRPPACPELVEGKAEIHVAPPISIARLLGVTRYLENTLHVKVLQTSGSWSLGSVITVQVDKPVPLVDILRDVPNVAEAAMADSPQESSGAEQCPPRRIRVTLTGNGDSQSVGRGTRGQNAP
ncbi:MAG: hypothetical protein Q7T04_06270 [Dehalococcoidia bacterium]|nr:hypothetical protein [Dehalococcoidia bacterium]